MKQNFLWISPFKKQKSDIDDDIRVLSSVPVFDTLSERHIRKIHRILHIRKYNESELVFREGDPGVGMYIIRRGAISIYKEFPDITRQKIIDLKKGDFFGEIALLNDSFRSATAVCTEDTTLFGLFRPDLLALTDSDPKLGVKLIYRLAQIVAERLRISTDD